MSSSGAYVSESSHSLQCENDDCGFEGFVEVWADYEVYACGWRCPDCDNEHLLEWDWDQK